MASREKASEDPTVEAWFSSAPDGQIAILRKLREMIRSADPGAAEEWKWSRPCYSNGRGLCCYLYSTKNYATLGFYKGSSLDDPEGLVEGTGANLRHVKVRTLDGIEPAIEALIRQAAEL